MRHHHKMEVYIIIHAIASNTSITSTCNTKRLPYIDLLCIETEVLCAWDRAGFPCLPCS
jgi:hypothetical protein